MRRLVLCAFVVGACGSQAAEAPPPVMPETIEPAPPEPEKPPPGSLWRDDVTETIEGGLGLFLQRVTVEPEVHSGRFHGFRIVDLQPPEWWQGVDLKPGDVVTGINGMPIERETQAYAAFEALRAADELEVSYQRGGEARRLVYSIVDKVEPKAPVAPSSPATKPETAPAPSDAG